MSYLADLNYIAYYCGHDIRSPPFVKNMHDPLSTDKPIYDFNSWERSYYKKAYDNAIAAVVTDDELLEHLKKYRKDHVRISGYIVDTTLFNPDVEPIHKTKEKFTFLSPARMGLQKGTDKIWKALNLCQSDFEVIQIKWYDNRNPNEEKIAKKWIENPPKQVKFVPIMPRDELGRNMVSVDAILGQVSGIQADVERSGALCKKPVVHYADRSAEYAPFFGPNVAVISSGSDKKATIPNNNPEGDLWYDTRAAPGGAGPSNHAYVYRTNTSFSNSTHYKHSSESGYTAGKKGYISTGKGAWAQTTHNSATSGPWNPATAQTGWWSLQDPAAGDIQALVDAEASARQAQDNILDALVSDAQAAADREILAFFEEEIYTPTATGNGDVWIHTNTITKTDGTLNTGAIFVANTKQTGAPYGSGGRYWWAAPNNAIGLMYAKAYTSGVSGSFERGTNYIPRALSTWDAPESDYTFRTGDGSEITPTPYYINSRGGDNIASKELANGWHGSTSLRLKINSGGVTTARKAFMFANVSTVSHATPYTQSLTQGSFDEYAIQIPKGKRWIYSLYAYSNHAGSVT